MTLTLEENRLYKCRHGVAIYNDDVLNVYDEWKSPNVIVSDGPYGLNAFYGDCKTPEDLPKWYEPHIKVWSKKAKPGTILWFWNSEIGWALVHPVLARYGWVYVRFNIWDKTIAHVAGNTNTKRLREFPCVTEACVQYVKEARIGNKTLKEWLRSEWERTELPLYEANVAAGVANAATRKWLTKDHLWYAPPPEQFEKLVEYANNYGRSAGRPYFSVNGKRPMTRKEYATLQPKFYCKAGVTNVWREPPLHGPERIKVKKGGKAVHLNQKPLKLMKLIIEASSDAGDVIWEPFGGLCSAAIAAHQLGRKCYAAEIEREFFKIAVKRLKSVCLQVPLYV
jgi:site-specific DNA-methyltransferase (adenine-specific)